jgi:hypothetical protein
LNNSFISFRLIECRSHPIVNGEDRENSRPGTCKEVEMSLLNAFDRYLVGFRVRRDMARTERMISSLPAEVQKDIGWPDAYDDVHARLLRAKGPRL